MARTGTVQRETKETKIDLSLSLDGSGKVSANTGVGFLDHMLTLMASHRGTMMGPIWLRH